MVAGDIEGVAVGHGAPPAREASQDGLAFAAGEGPPSIWAAAWPCPVKFFGKEKGRGRGMIFGQGVDSVRAGAVSGVIALPFVGCGGAMVALHQLRSTRILLAGDVGCDMRLTRRVRAEEPMCSCGTRIAGGATQAGGRSRPSKPVTEQSSARGSRARPGPAQRVGLVVGGADPWPSRGPPCKASRGRAHSDGNRPASSCALDDPLGAEGQALVEQRLDIATESAARPVAADG